MHVMDHAAWLQKTLDELVELALVAENDPADAWRAAALIARLLGSPSGPVPPAVLVRRLPEILAVAGMPDPQQLLDRVADELESDTDPWGPLLDALLDADDAFGVLTTSGQSQMALELARRTAGLVSMFPERVISLGPFADMRLQTVRENAAAGLLWSAVERAPAHALVEALPAPASFTAHAEKLRPSRRTLVGAYVWSLRLPEQLHQAAAASETAEVCEFETKDAGLRAWVEAEGGRMKLEIRGVGAESVTATLVAERAVDGVEVSSVTVNIEVSGSTAYVDLGPWAGPENLLHRLVAASGLASSQVRFRLTVADG